MASPIIVEAVNTVIFLAFFRVGIVSEITNSSNSKAYPISCFTWLILYKDQDYSNRSESQAKATMQLIDWMLSPAAQSLTTKVNYAPLPASVIENAKKQLSSINFGGKALLK